MRGSDVQSFEGEGHETDVHVVLLGDSTLDNGRYLNLDGGEVSVEKQLMRRCMEQGWDMTVLAQDGSMLEDVRQRQLPLIPECATHLVMSASGNDLLLLLNQMVAQNFSMGSIYGAVVNGLQEVADSYREILQTLKSTGRHLACCTVYRPNFNHMFFKALAIFSLGLHNGRIRGASQDLDISVIDLASIFDAHEDFATPLELSTRGGGKLVENIVSFIGDHPINTLPCRRNPNVIFADEEQFQPAGNSRFVSQMRCCAARAPLRRIYASKAYSLALEAPDPMVGSPMGPALEFSKANQPWREM